MEGPMLHSVSTDNANPTACTTSLNSIVTVLTPTTAMPTKVGGSSATTNVTITTTTTTTTTEPSVTGVLPTKPLPTLPVRKPIQNLPIELQNDQKRRSSSRTIKRKRFDDEIVEYNVTIPTNRSGADAHRHNRPRNSFPNFPGILGTTSSVGPLPIVAHPETALTPGSAEILLPGTPTQVAASSTFIPASPSTGATPNQPTLPIAAAKTVSHPKATMDRAPTAERRPRPVRSANKKSQRRRPVGPMATKDLGRWKPIDDLALIIGVQQTNDLRMIHRGVKFSCKFTLQELQQRWYALLYEPAVSRIAVSAMRNLHPELVESVQRKALYSVQEEDLLGTIKSTETPKLEQFQELLSKNASVFYWARTGKSLQNHWLLLKQYSLLPDQSVKSYNGTEPLTFSDAEEQIFDHDLQEAHDEAVDIESGLADRRKKRDIRCLENELSRWGVLVDSVLGPTAASEFDNQTLACLCGRNVRYLMRSKEISFGRDAKDYVVDVDLSLEGPAAKISRRQGTIKLRSNGDFFIANEGKRAIFIDSNPILSGHKARLAHNCTVEMSGLRFTFLVNYDLINAIRQENAKTSNPLN